MSSTPTTIGEQHAFVKRRECLIQGRACYSLVLARRIPRPRINLVLYRGPVAPRATRWRLGADPIGLDQRFVLVETPVTRWLSTLCQGTAKGGRGWRCEGGCSVNGAATNGLW